MNASDSTHVTTLPDLSDDVAMQPAGVGGLDDLELFRVTAVSPCRAR